MSRLLSSVVFFLFALGSAASKNVPPVTVAVCHLTHGSPKGSIHFFQEVHSSPVNILGKLLELPAGMHGFHVHKSGNITGGCQGALGHYNPDKVVHGAPNDTIRHVGDLGNILATDDNVAMIDIWDSVITLNGPRSIIGRSIVVHEKADDLGRGTSADSLTTGNAGGRLNCCLITEEDNAPDSSSPFRRHIYRLHKKLSDDQ
ncbi:superoxide dismutase [Cu-Zn] 5-like [Ornithodoros turicata]|uniref:superoxide dismutase [Cu-Zn] 5-like n=1 Tax=Ornithodoros turicata TaxID=34597 RepID=UPI00313A0420